MSSGIRTTDDEDAGWGRCQDDRHQKLLFVGWVGRDTVGGSENDNQLNKLSPRVCI